MPQPMLIPADQVESKKKIGKIRKGDRTIDVHHIKLKGGLHLVVGDKNEPIAMGSHRGVAYHLASKYEPDLELSELSKSEHCDVDSFRHLLPKYDAMSQALRDAWKSK